MYDFDFDPETNGIELSWRDTGGEIPRREARPVYAEELNTLGMDRRWRYDAACPAPPMSRQALALPDPKLILLLSDSGRLSGSSPAATIDFFR